MYTQCLLNKLLAKQNQTRWHAGYHQKPENHVHAELSEAHNTEFRGFT